MNKKFHLQQLLREIEQLAQKGQWSAVERGLQQARTIFPDQPIVWFGLGNAAYQQGKLKVARENWLKAKKLAPNDINIGLHLARCLRDLEHDNEALRELKRLYNIQPNHLAVQLDLANSYIDMGEKTAAAKLFKDILSEMPCQVSAWSGLSILGELTPAKHLDKVLSCLDDQRLSVHDRARLLFIVGRLEEKQKNFDSSWDAYKKANLAWRGLANLNFSNRIDSARQLINDFDQDAFESIHAQRHNSSAPVFIVGMPRSGTTLLERMLAAHPSIDGLGERRVMGQLLLKAIQKLAAGGKVVQNLDKSHPKVWKNFGDQYLQQLHKHRSGGRFFVDKMPLNANLTGLIHLVFPKATIIYCRRKPEDIAISCLSVAFDETQLRFTPEELGELIGLQESLMNHWMKILPKNTIHVVDYEKLVVNPEQNLNPLLETMKLPWSPQCLQFNKSKDQVKTASVMQVRRKLYTSSVGRGKRFGDRLKPVLDNRIRAIKELS